VGHILNPFERVELADRLVPGAFGPLDGRVEYVVDERGLSRSADAGDHGQGVQRDDEVDVLQVVLAGAGQLDLLSGAAATRLRYGNRQFLTQVLRAQRAWLQQQRVERARAHRTPALLPGAQT